MLSVNKNPWFRNYNIMKIEYQKILDQYNQLQKQMQDPATSANAENYKKVGQDFAEYKEVYNQVQHLDKINQAITEAKDSLKIKELKEMAEQELAKLEPEQAKLEASLAPARHAMTNTAVATAWLEGWVWPVEKAIGEVLMSEAASPSC